MGAVADGYREGGEKWTYTQLDTFITSIIPFAVDNKTLPAFSTNTVNILHRPHRLASSLRLSLLLAWFLRSAHPPLDGPRAVELRQGRVAGGEHCGQRVARLVVKSTPVPLEEELARQALPSHAVSQGLAVAMPALLELPRLCVCVNRRVENTHLARYFSLSFFLLLQKKTVFSTRCSTWTVSLRTSLRFLALASARAADSRALRARVLACHM